MYTLQFYDSHFSEVETTKDKNGDYVEVIRSESLGKIEKYIEKKLKKENLYNENKENLKHFFENIDYCSQYQWSDCSFNIDILEVGANI